MLLRTFESLLGLPAGFLKPEQSAANRSLTLGEAELARLINEEFKRREWPVANYAAFMRYGVIKQLKTRQPAEDEQRIVTPPWARYRAAEIGAEMARNIAALGVRVVGDLAELGRPPDSLAQAEADDWPARPLILAEAAVRALVGAFIVGGVGGQAVADAAPAASPAPARQAGPSPQQASPSSHQAAPQQQAPLQAAPPPQQQAPLPQSAPAAPGQAAPHRQPSPAQAAASSPPPQARSRPDLPSPPDPPQPDPAPARPEPRRAPQHASRPVDARGLTRVLAGLRRPRTRKTQRLSR
jgi:hypothetical protein